ncbi:MAG: hypothetical protein N2C12_06400, partial [Planctomycetales bacterium]
MTDQAQKPVVMVMATVGIVVYVVVFFWAKINSIELNAFRRISVFEWFGSPLDLIAIWLGDPGDAAIFDRATPLIVAILIVLFAIAIGWWLMSLVGADRRLDGTEVVVFAAATGLSVVSLGTLLLGLIGCLSWWCFAIPSLAALAGVIWHYQHRQPRKNSQSSLTLEAPGLSKRWLWLTLPACLYLVLGGMLPPSDFDVREYHLQAPKEFFQQGQIVFLPHNAYAQMPLAAEMPALLGMVLLDDWWTGALVGKTVIALVSLLTGLAVFAAGRRFHSNMAGVVAAVLFLALPWTARVSMSGLIDGVVGFYGLLSIYAVLLACRFGTPLEHDSRPTPPGLFLLAGLMAGSAVACKYPAL